MKLLKIISDIYKTLAGHPQVSPRITEELKWPSPIAQKVLNDLDKCPAWEWHSPVEYDNPYLGHTYEYHQHPYLNYRLTNWFSIEKVSLDSKDIEFIRVKFCDQRSSRRNLQKMLKLKENLTKLGFDYEIVKPWLTQYY